MTQPDQRAPRQIYIKLDEADFKALVAGKEVAKDGARIILADIGWACIIHAVTDAIRANR